MKLHEAIEKYGKGDGVKLVNGGVDIFFTPYYRVMDDWYGKDELGRSITWSHDGLGNWELYQEPVEPVEMEDRWLWAWPDGSIVCDPNSMGVPKLYASLSTKLTKLEWSRTSFPKEKE